MQSKAKIFDMPDVRKMSCGNFRTCTDVVRFHTFLFSIFKLRYGYLTICFDRGLPSIMI